MYEIPVYDIMYEMLNANPTHRQRASSTSEMSSLLLYVCSSVAAGGCTLPSIFAEKKDLPCSLREDVSGILNKQAKPNTTARPVIASLFAGL